ncbi:MAG TPA: class I SAM-dependent methyltransferase [bacterium]|nr:class I SAM-dependent methyltransferase [Candidatus Omnitrophota bacterium]HOL93747.1 class I SAM-dependent methyltransferase [bacterium]HPP01268.1 class I SAM-dependent methyltransferase [bacterium]
MTSHSESPVAGQLKRYYQTSLRYRDDLKTHDEAFLEPFLILVERHVPKPARILDLGCGTGLSARLLEQRGYMAFGLDLSPLFLSVEKQKDPDVKLLAGDALRLPFGDGIFDAVAAFEFIEHVPDVPSLLEECLRVLKPGGFLVFHSPNLLSPYLPAFDLLRMALGGRGRPVFAETIPQAFGWLKKNLWLSWKKKLSPRPGFLYREPDLSEREIGGDSDSVYLANPIDLARYLHGRGCVIEQRGHAMSWRNKVIVALTPNFAPYMGLVARTPHRPAG